MVGTYSQEQMVGIGVAFLILPVSIVSLRIWAKVLGRRRLGWDDYMIFFSLVRPGKMHRLDGKGPNGDLVLFRCMLYITTYWYVQSQEEVRGNLNGYVLIYKS